MNTFSELNFQYFIDNCWLEHRVVFIIRLAFLSKFVFLCVSTSWTNLADMNIIYFCYPILKKKKCMMSIFWKIMEFLGTLNANHETMYSGENICFVFINIEVDDTFSHCFLWHYCSPPFKIYLQFFFISSSFSMKFLTTLSREVYITFSLTAFYFWVCTAFEIWWSGNC